MFFFKPKTAYVLRISDWSADVCSTDLVPRQPSDASAPAVPAPQPPSSTACNFSGALPTSCGLLWAGVYCAVKSALWRANTPDRSEEHTSELQSLMRISYAVFCLKKKQTTRIQ